MLWIRASQRGTLCLQNYHFKVVHLFKVVACLTWIPLFGFCYLEPMPLQRELEYTFSSEQGKNITIVININMIHMSWITSTMVNIKVCKRLVLK